jgi:N-methylhydantoinase B
MDIPPPGRAGGAPGAAGTWSVDRHDGSHEAIPAKAANVAVAAGERFVLRTSGGGGLGPPERRDPELVLADVRAGKVTVEGAARDYGVVVADGRVDRDATARLRQGRSGK